MKNSQQKIQNEKGFTIIETIIALAIFSIAVAGVITVTTLGGINGNASKNRTVANYLAEEGIELMRAKRDTSVIATSGDPSVGWGDFTSAATTNCTASAPCDVSVTTPGLDFCTAGSCFPLNYDAGDGFYNHDAITASNQPSLFTRQITAVKNTDDEVDITVTVLWYEGTSRRSVVNTESLFNWYGTP